MWRHRNTHLTEDLKRRKEGSPDCEDTSLDRIPARRRGVRAELFYKRRDTQKISREGKFNADHDGVCLQWNLTSARFAALSKGGRTRTARIRIRARGFSRRTFQELRGAASPLMSGVVYSFWTVSSPLSSLVGVSMLAKSLAAWGTALEKGKLRGRSWSKIGRTPVQRLTGGGEIACDERSAGVVPLSE